MGFRGKFKNKRDANEPEIIAALQAHGFSVERMDTPGDLLLGKHGKTFLAEVKMEGATLSPAQLRFYQSWRGNQLILRSVQDVIEWVSQINKEE